MYQLLPTLPLSLEDLEQYYRTALSECKFIDRILNESIALLEARMKPSAVVSYQFNYYEAYFCTLVEHLRWRVHPICVNPKLPIGNSPLLTKINHMKYKPSGIGHPIGFEEIDPMKLNVERLTKLLENLLIEIEKSKLKSIFLCHSSKDKNFARELATDLTLLGTKVWLDEAELEIGDSMIEKIQEAIHDCDYLGVLLSKNSVKSQWVKKELEIALNEEIQLKRVKALPLLLDDCQIPGFLAPKYYADFRKPEKYGSELEKLLKRLKNR